MIPTTKLMICFNAIDLVVLGRGSGGAADPAGCGGAPVLVYLAGAPAPSW